LPTWHDVNKQEAQLMPTNPRDARLYI